MRVIAQVYDDRVDASTIDDIAIVDLGSGARLYDSPQAAADAAAIEAEGRPIYVNGNLWDGEVPEE